MRLSTPASLLLLLATSGQESLAFTPSSLIYNSPRSHAILHMSSPDNNNDGPVKKKVLTAADVMAKSAATKAMAGGDPSSPGEQDAPKLFSPAIYDDFQSSLLLLEKRIKEGPGSLSSEEVMQFTEETDRIVKEMREFMADPEGMAESIRKGYEGGSDAVVDVAAKKEDTAVVEAASVPEPTIPPPKQAVASKAPDAPATPPAVTASPVDSSTTSSPPLPNIPPEEVDDSDAAKGYGLAKGTTNTYIIPNMEEMSPEEYRDKLQETISARQAQRRKMSLSNNKGIIGNASSQGYLDSLSRNQG